MTDQSNEKDKKTMPTKSSKAKFKENKRANPVSSRWEGGRVRSQWSWHFVIYKMYFFQKTRQRECWLLFTILMNISMILCFEK